MKTILITIPNIVPSLAFLRTSFLAHLQQGDVRVVLVVPAYRAEYYRKEFAGRNDIEVAVPPNGYRTIERWADAVFRQSIPTRTIAMRQAFGLYANRSFFISRLLQFICCRTLWVLGHARAWRRFLRFTYSFLPSAAYAPMLDTYRPDALFITTLYDPVEMGLMRAARKRAIPVIGMVKSWDNLTSKCFIPMPPDVLCVQNEIVRDEAIAFSDYPPEHIRVYGEPRFDFYADRSFILPREKFLRGLGLNPRQRYVLFAGEGLSLVPGECDALRQSFDEFAKHPTCKDLSLVYRPHPNYESCIGKLGNRPLVVHQSHKRIKNTLGGWEFERDDISELMSVIYHSDAVAMIASTIAVEAAILDKPIIGIAFGGSHKPYIRSTRSHYDTNHFSNVVRTGGVRMVESAQEFAAAVAAYRTDPSLDYHARAKLAREQAFVTDGRAAERVALEIRRVLFDGHS